MQLRLEPLVLRVLLVLRDPTELMEQMEVAMEVPVLFQVVMPEGLVEEEELVLVVLLEEPGVLEQTIIKVMEQMVLLLLVEMAAAAAVAVQVVMNVLPIMPETVAQVVLRHVLLLEQAVPEVVMVIQVVMALMV